MTCYAAGFLVAVGALLVLPLQAQAQTTLVSNTGQVLGGNSSVVTSQPFTTGGNSDGYTLTSVGVGLATSAADILVRIAPNASSGEPDLSDPTKLITLTNPGSFVIGVNTFTAPAGTTLAAGTTYHVYVTNEDGDDSPSAMQRTTSTDEDGGAAADWSIENTRYWKSIFGLPWSTSGSIFLRIRIDGTLNDGTTTLSTDATLTNLALNDGTTEHTIDLATTPYTVNVGNAVTTVTLTATPTHTGASVSAVTLGGTAIADIDFTDGITVPSLAEGDNEIDVTVTAEDLTAMKTYMVTVTRGAPITVAPITVPSNWNLKPSGLSAGDEFRLLFITSTTRNAVPTAIADYNSFVQNRAAAGHMDIQSHSSGFSAVGSTEDVDARDNTSTTYTSSDKGVPIYWLDGNKVVDDYEDFYDGDWDEETTLKNESGNTFNATGSTRMWTGSNHDGTEVSSFGISNALGRNPARTGRPNSTSASAGPLTTTGLEANAANTETRRLYALSSVFVVGDGPTLSSDATLSALELSGVTLAPTFVSATTETYTATVVNSVTETTVTAAPTHSGATVAFKDGDDNALTNPVTLTVGANVIKAVVTAEDTTTMKTYMVTVTREATTDTLVTIEAEYESIGGGLEDLLFTLTREGETTDALAVKVTIVQAQTWLGNSDLEHDVTFSANSATAELTITASKFSFTPSTAGDLTATVSGDGIDGGSDTVQIISTSAPPITASYDMPAYTFAEDATDKAIYLEVTLDAAYPRAVAIDAGSFSSRGGTATSPEDFVAYFNQHVVSPGEFTRDVDTDPLVARELIQDFIVDDAIYEGSESFVMKIEAGPGLSADLLQFAYPDGTTCAPYSCSPGVEYPVTITDEGDLPVLSLSVDPASIAEEDDDGTTNTAENVSTVTVEITNGKTFAVDQTVTLTFSGTATQGTHYSVNPGDADSGTEGHQVVLEKETASVEVTVTAVGNDTADGPRTVTVKGKLGAKDIGSRDITILDDETTTTAPAIVTGGVRATSMPLVGDTYGLGETIEITVTFDNAVTVGTSGGTPRIQFRLDGGLNRWAEYSSSFSSIDLVFTYVVQSGDMDAVGIWLPENFLQLQGGTISAAADNTVNATLTYDRPGLQMGHKVNGDTPVTIEAEHESIGAGLEDLLFTLTREGETTDALEVTVTITQAQTWLSDLEYTVTFPADSSTAELTITASNFSFTPPPRATSPPR